MYSAYRANLSAETVAVFSLHAGTVFLMPICHAVMGSRQLLTSNRWPGVSIPGLNKYVSGTSGSAGIFIGGGDFPDFVEPFSLSIRKSLLEEFIYCLNVTGTEFFGKRSPFFSIHTN